MASPPANYALEQYVDLVSCADGEHDQQHNHCFFCTHISQLASSSSSLRTSTYNPSLALIFAQIATMSGPADTNLGDVDHITFADLEKHDEFLRVCPDWRKWHITWHDLVGLTNDVHPVFDAGRFQGGRINPKEIKQARLFASRLLEADCSIRFWWDLMSSQSMSDVKEREAKAAHIRMFTYGEPSTSQAEMDKTFQDIQQAREPGRVLAFYPPPESLTENQITKIKADLRELARHIHYRVAEDTEDSRFETAWFAKTAPPFRGSPSRVVISTEELRVHSAAMEGDLMCQVWASVSLGFKLLQLLAHAAVGATRSGPECNWTNMYRFDVEEDIGAQIRMLESCTFGGVLRREQEHEQVAKSHYTINGAEGVPGLWFAFSDWPSVDIFTMIGCIPSDEDEQLEQENNGPFYHREWQVPFFWILKLLTDSFWDNDVHRRGQSALIPPRDVGYVMRRDDEEKYGPLHSGEIRPGVIPDGYGMLPRSCVMVRHQLLPEGRRVILFGNFGTQRMAFDSSGDEMDVDDDEGQSGSSSSSGSGGSELVETDATSDSD